MSKRLRLILILELMAGAFTYASPQAGQNGAVEFVLIDAGSSAPLPGGRIWMQGPTITRSSQAIPKRAFDITATTDKDGHATLSNLVPGGYQVKIQKVGYIVPNTKAGNESNMYVTIELGKPAQRVLVSLTRGAVISGTIYDANEAPIVGAHVSIGTLRYQNGRRIFDGLGSAQTDDLGNYRLFWYGPGEYYIIASHEIQARMMPGLYSDLYSKSYYPGTIDMTKAKSITITDGKDARGISFAFKEAKPRHVKGKFMIPPENSSVGAQNGFRLGFICWLGDASAQGTGMEIQNTELLHDNIHSDAGRMDSKR